MNNLNPHHSATKHIILIIISVAMFMEGLDVTIVNTAIPTMAYSLNVIPIDLKIALISYLLSLAIFIPISGWLADKFGAKRVFLLALIVFTLSSYWCGFADSLSDLVLARSTQGIGGAFMLPVGRLIIVRNFERNEIIPMMSRVAMIAAIGPMLGPFVGGLIVHHFSWRWIFWVNIPVGIIAIIATFFKLTPVTPEPVLPLDKIGFILFGFGLALLAFGLSALSESNIDPMIAYLSIVLSIILLISYVLHSRGRVHPIVNTHLLSYRTFRIAALGNLLARLGVGGITFLLPLLLQIALGYSALISGILLVPTAMGLMIVRPFIKRVIKKLYFKWFLMLNTMFLGLIIWSFMLINNHFPLIGIALLTLIFGIGSSLQFSVINPLAYSEAPSEYLGDVTSILGTIQQISQSISVAFCAIILRHLSEHNLLTVPVFRETFFIMGLFTLCASILFIRLRPEDGKVLVE